MTALRAQKKGAGKLLCVSGAGAAGGPAPHPLRQTGGECAAALGALSVRQLRPAGKRSGGRRGAKNIGNTYSAGEAFLPVLLKKRREGQTEAVSRLRKVTEKGIIIYLE